MKGISYFFTHKELRHSLRVCITQSILKEIEWLNYNK